ncbi:trichohyalin-like isoform X2 [Cyclopterus lumpus]|uniref:trichohyalin-like isoform X2 n=1 Tax=Cyclopterus lumpus TaxID=8103 RepID=UPI001485FD8E|nr:trichohyalin-like isoform X2 [Cyclopterus lumpus]
MADLIGSKDDEKSLLLAHITYLEEQIERCQQVHDQREERNRELSSRYDALEKDKKECIEHLKQRVHAKERKEDELEQQLQLQPLVAAQAQQALPLQLSLELQRQRQRCDALQSEIQEREAECLKQLKQQEVKQQELKEQRMQQKLDAETRKRRHARDVEELKAAIDNLKTDTEPEREKKIAVTKVTLDGSVEGRAEQILQEGRDLTGEQSECLRFLLEKNKTLPIQRDAMRDQNRDLCLRRDQLNADLKKCIKEKITSMKAVEQMTMEYQQLKAELEACSSAHSSVLARTVALKRLAASESEESRQRAGEAAQLGAELQRESVRTRQLQSILGEGVVILKHILREEESVTECEMDRLLDILESSAQ